MRRNAYLDEKIMLTNKVNTPLFEVGKVERVALIKRVKLTQEFDDALEGWALLKV